MAIAERVRVVARPALCRDCQACTLGCSLYHEGQSRPSTARLRVVRHQADHTFEIIVCRQCPDPACLPACPVDAMALKAGVVHIDPVLCVLCGACAEACPHGAIFHHEALGRYLKCDLCGERDGGALCVELCPVGALLLETGG